MIGSRSACFAAGLVAVSLICIADRVAVGEGGSSCAAIEISVPEDRLASLARGFNLNGWLDGPETRRPDFELLADLRKRGFTHIRLAVAPERLLSAFGTAEQVAQNFGELDTAIRRLLGLGFAVSLDIHPGQGLGGLQTAKPEQAFRLLDQLWRTLARRYRDENPERLFFEVLNEPRFASELWASMGPLLAESIRRQAPDHTIIYPLSGFQRLDELSTRQPLAQPNIIYAVHFYDPMIFTHQGLDWNPGDPLANLHDVPFPAEAADPRIIDLKTLLRSQGQEKALALIDEALRKPWDDDRIEQAFAEGALWSRTHGAPLTLNEFGVLAWKAEPLDRLRWLRTVRTAAEQNCIGWAMWDYAGGFGFVRRMGDLETVDEGVLAAILGTAPAAMRGANAAH
jgi:endoglucanase